MKRGVFVSVGDGPRILVSVSLLDGRAGWRRTNRSLLASLGRSPFHRFDIHNVHALGRGDAQDGCRSRLVESDTQLRSERGRESPPVGKFNYGQKLWFWLIFYGVILLFLSGLGLWFTESIPWNLRFLRYTAILIHVGAALLTIGGFFIHVYMSTVLEEGSFNSMIEGGVSTAWAKEFHRLWYDRIVQKTPPNK